MQVTGQALGVAGLATGSPVLGGAMLGAGTALEQDKGALGTAFDTALGAGGGKLLELVGKPLFNVAGKVVGEITPQFLKDLAGKGTKAIEEFASHHDIVPDFVSKTTSKIDDVLGAGKKAIGDEFNAIKGKLGIKMSATPEQTALEAITPRTKDLTPTEYEKLLAQRKITPKSTTKPSEYILSDSEKATAKKYESLLQDKDPVKNSTNLIGEISDKDKKVGDFLTENNSIFNSGELKNHISSELENVSDVTIPEDRIQKLKSTMIDNFIKELPKNDMKSLWEARKEFDQKIEKAFSGSPTLQNEMKKAFRNSVQNFIAERTPNEVYKGYMKDMTELFNLNDVVATKATKEKGLNAIQTWIKQNPTKAKIIGWGSALIPVGGAIYNTLR